MIFQENTGSADGLVGIAALRGQSARRESGAFILRPPASQIVAVVEAVIDSHEAGVVECRRPHVGDEVDGSDTRRGGPEWQQSLGNRICDGSPLLGRRHRRGTHLRRYLSEAFPGQQEKRPIFPDRTTEGCAVLITM